MTDDLHSALVRLQEGQGGHKDPEKERECGLFLILDALVENIGLERRL